MAKHWYIAARLIVHQNYILEAYGEIYLLRQARKRPYLETIIRAGLKPIKREK